MNNRFCLLLILSLRLSPGASFAQPVPRTTLVEHFTNTYCSVCASRNPGFLENLAAFPEVLHIAYYPSSPYAACPFNQMNKVENDAHTKFYGVYGSTPRLVINGAVIPANADYNSPSLFQASQTQTSDYALNVSVRRINETTGEASIRVKQVAANALQELSLYAVVSEDTVHFNARNGETIHYDLFHKSLTGAEAQALDDISSVGDSTELVYNFSIGSGWGNTRVTAMLQDSTKAVLQAARSAPVPLSTNIPTGPCKTPLCMYPVPVRDRLHFSNLAAGYHNYTIINSYGQLAKAGVVYDIAQPISLGALPGGYYIITIGEGSQMMRGSFVKD
jgi:hypothetical protein